MKALNHDDNWDIIRDNLKRRWSILTDADPVYEIGKEQAFVDRIQKRTGESLEEVEKKYPPGYDHGRCLLAQN